MTNPTRPSTAFPDWASSPPTGYVQTPPTGVQTVGFGPFDVYQPSHYNWLFQRSADWIGYLADVFDATGRLKIGRIVGEGDPDGSGAGLYVTTASGAVTVVPAGNANATLQTAGTGTAKIAATGAGGKARIEATGGAGTAFVETVRTTGEVGIGGVELDVSFTSFGNMSFGGAFSLSANGAFAGMSAIGGPTTVSVILTAASGEAALSGVTLAETFTTSATTTAPTISLVGSTRTRSRYRHDFTEGLLAVKHPTDGLIYGYGNGSGAYTFIAFECDLDPALGGYSQYDVNSSQGYGRIYAATSNYTRIINYGGSTMPSEFRRPLWEVKHNASAAGAAAPVAIYRVASLSATWSAGSGSAYLRLVRRHRTTYAETTILESTPASPTDNNGGTPIQLDTATYTYFVSFGDSSVTAGASSEGVKGAMLELDKRAVE